MSIDHRALLWGGLVPGVASLPCIVMAWSSGDGRSALAFGVTIAIAGATVLASRLQCPSPAPPPLQQVKGNFMATVALAWAIAPIIAAIPFAIAWAPNGARNSYLVDGLFESMSGVTSCGLSVLGDPADAPATLLLWRSLLQWFGGIGIASFALLSLTRHRNSGRLLELEFGTQLGPSTQSAVQWIWLGYVILGLTTFGALCTCGMPPFDALIYALSSTSTGGFGTSADSMASANRACQAIAMSAGFVSALSFGLIFTCIVRRSVKELFSAPMKLFLGAGCLTAGLLWISERRWGEVSLSPEDAALQAASAIATTGYSTVDVSTLCQESLFVLSLAMFLGGMAGSTAGGFKVDRLWLCLRAVAWRAIRAFSEDWKREVRIIGRERFSPRDARLRSETAASLGVLWLITIVLGTLLLRAFSPSELSLSQVGFEAVSALSTVGLTAGTTQTDSSAGAKLVLSGLMWLGRLELFAGIYLIARLTHRGPAARPAS